MKISHNLLVFTYLALALVNIIDCSDLNYKSKELTRRHLKPPPPGQDIHGKKVDIDVLNNVGKTNINGRKRRANKGTEESLSKKSTEDALTAAADAVKSVGKAIEAAMYAAEADEVNSNSIDGKDKNSNVIVNEKYTMEKDGHFTNYNHNRKRNNGSRARVTKRRHTSSDSSSYSYKLDSKEVNGDGNSFDKSDGSESESERDQDNNNSQKEAADQADANIPNPNPNEVKSSYSNLLALEIVADVRKIYSYLAKKQKNLLDQMEKMKNEFQTVIDVLNKENSEKVEERKRRKREKEDDEKEAEGEEENEKDEKADEYHDAYLESEDNQEPYRACVYIDPASEIVEQVPEGEEANSVSENEETSDQAGDFTPPFVPEAPDFIQESEDFENYEPNPAIDVTSVYWVILPEGETEMPDVNTRIQGVVSEIQGSGQDVLIIPVTKGLTTTEEIAQNFLSAISANPRNKKKVAKKRKIRDKSRKRVKRKLFKVNKVIK